MVGDTISNAGRGETEETFEAGRAVVREVLVNRLNAAGLRPRKGCTAAAQAKIMDHLVQGLSYMTPDNLATLAESILIHAAQPGPDRGLWPREVLIRGWAQVLQSRPFRLHPIVASWLRSREGPVALAGGYLVPLLRWLKRHRRPLLVYDMTLVRQEAEELQKRLTDIRARLDQGYSWPGDHELMEAWARDHAEALQYVDEGSAARALKAAQAAQGEGAAA